MYSFSLALKIDQDLDNILDVSLDIMKKEPVKNVSFDGLGIAPKILEVLDRIKFTIPTPIQYKAIPVAIDGADIVGVALRQRGLTDAQEREAEILRLLCRNARMSAAEMADRLNATAAEVETEIQAMEADGTIMGYSVVINSDRLPEQEVRALLQETPTGEPLMQTFIEKYIEQGEQRGMQLGEQRGMQLGEAKMLLRQIERKFGPPSEPVRARITQADPDTLLEWSERILVAQTLDDVLH